MGNLVSIDGNMNAELYQTILREDLLGSMDYYGLNVEDVVFEHDNDPKHTAKSITVWLADQSFEVLDWPLQSPDLNAIENLWSICKRKLSDYELTPTSMHELW